MRKLRIIIYLLAMLSSLLFVACDGGKSTGGGGDTNATSSNWDQMKWDQGKWK